MKQIISIIILIVLSLLIALCGSAGGYEVNDSPIIFYCWLIAFCIQYLIFIPSFIFKTERLFDFTGMVAFLSIMIYILYSRPIQDLNYTGKILIILISVWTLRLGFFLLLRIHKDGRDRRFDELKIHFLKFLSVWTMQGFWVFVTASCAISVLCSDVIEDRPVFIVTGLAVWLLGFLVEIISDSQKRIFRKTNHDDFISSGLWSYSRHPNYLGEILLWTGIAVICLPNLEGTKYVTLVSPVFVYFLLTRISGINLLEQHSDEKWGHLESYKNYKKSTPILFPFKRNN